MDRSHKLIRLAGRLFEQMGSGRPRHSTRARPARRFMPSGLGPVPRLEVLEARMVLSTVVDNPVLIDGPVYVPPGHDPHPSPDPGTGITTWSATEHEIVATITGGAPNTEYALALYAAQSKGHPDLDDNLTAQILLKDENGDPAIVTGKTDANGDLVLAYDVRNLKNLPGHKHIQGDVWSLDKDFTVDEIPHKLLTGNSPSQDVIDHFQSGQLYDVTVISGKSKKK